MTAENIKVAILGAAGESAGRILSGLLESKTPKYVCFLIMSGCVMLRDPNEENSANRV